jgi:protein-S-isoprenylcysteine O-methyltransferase Ste14
VWIPVVVVWVAHPFFTAVARWAPLPLRPVYESAWVAWPAAVCAGVCLWASRVCWKTMGKNWRMGIDPGEQNALVVAGPFAYVRHPIYALSQGMMVVTVVAIPSPVMIAAGVVHVLLLQWEARREEGHLKGVHGSKYDEYCAGVGRFIPRLRRV